MGRKADLFILIKSLSKSEKRSFKLEASHFKVVPAYIKLFNAIDSQEVYDESEIRRIFSEEKFLKQLHVMKNYLKAKILKSLRNFHAVNAKEMELRNCMSHVEILFNKELYDHCTEELDKAERIARDYEFFSGLNEVQNWQRKVAQNKSPQDYESFLKIIQDQKKTIDQLINKNNYYTLIVEISQSLLENKPIAQRHVRTLSSVGNATNFESGVLHYNARYFSSIQNDQSSGAILSELSDYFDRFPLQLSNSPGLYISSMNNAISYFVFDKSYDKALSLIDKVHLFIEGISLKNENRTLLKQVMRMYTIELELYRKMAITEEKVKEIEHIEQMVDKNRYKIPQDYLISFWFQLANVAFDKKDYSGALHRINMVLNTKFGDVRTDLQLHTRILNLMTHFELQNLFVLRYNLDSCRRFLKKIEFNDPFVKYLMKFFSRLGKAPLLEYKDFFKDLGKQLDLPEEGGSYIQTRTGYIDYKRWTQNRLQ
jgi:hypothetical protein